MIIALDPSAAGALSLLGNASINTPGVVSVDSSSSSALSASGNARVTAGAIDVHGGVTQSGNASLSPTPIMGAPVLAVTALPSPSTSGMTNYGSFSLGGNSSATIQPGIYSQISVSGNARLTMSSGIYIIEGGGFSVSGNASVTGSGVMIVNAGSNYPGAGGTYGGITLGGHATFSLSPATSGTYAGIVFLQPVDNPKTFTVSGNASGITGTIYAPGARLSESGNGALNASLIVDTLTISGNGIADGPATLSSTIVAGRTAAGDSSPATPGLNNRVGTGGPAAPIDVIDGNIVVADTNEAASVFNQTMPHKGGGTIPIKIKVIDALGNQVGSSSLTVVSLSAVGTDGNPAPQAAPETSQPGNLFTLDPTTGTDPLNLKTEGYKTRA